MSTINNKQIINPWYKEPWPWILMTGPVVVVIAGIITAVIAFTSNDGLVKDDYYKDGLAINQQIDRRDLAEKNLMKGQLLQNDGKLRLILSSANQQHLTDSLQLQFVHPQRSKLDQVLNLTSNSPGTFEIPLPNEINSSKYWFIILENKQQTWRLNGKYFSHSNITELTP